MPLDETTVREALGSYGVALEELRVLPLRQGDDNLNVLVSVRGARYVLRLYRLTPRAEITFELELVDFLAGRRFPTPRVHRRVDGGFLVDVHGVPGALFDFVDGRPIEETDPGDVSRIATLFARMHVLTSGRAFPGPRSRTDVGRLRHFEELAAANPGLARTEGVDRFRASIRSVLAEWESALRSADGPVPVGPIHHDPSPGNILVGPSGEVTALLDFDEAHVSHLVIDVAALLHYWALERAAGHACRLQPARVRHLIRGYEHVRPLTAAERRVLPMAMLVLNAADAAEYLTRWWAREPGAVKLDESLSLASFYALCEATDWRELLSQEVAA